ncbi:MAG TPA: hypothetical protein VHE54_05440 [Puia sp.]|nr:hypothetical protein [Puia sp.]
MKKVLPLRAEVSSILGRAQRDYRELAGSTTFSLKDLFSPAGFRFEEFCQGFAPHPDSARLTQVAQQFAEEHDIWLPNAKGHVSCALFLYPDAQPDRMIAIMKNLVIGFYLNDVMGRDLFRSLPANQQREARQLIGNMAGIAASLTVPIDAHPIEHLNARVLRQFRENSPETWFDRFLHFYCHHLNITHTDRNAVALGHIPGLDEYIENRCHYAGVHHVVLWIEYNNGQFLDWDLLEVLQLAAPLRRLHWLTAAFGCLSNDLFSFEKEVIDQGCDSNLVMILLLNNPDLSLKDGVRAACDIVRNLVMEFTGLLRSTRERVALEGSSYPSLSALLSDHIDGVCRCVQATWLWHCHSTRYKRAGSLWQETMTQ